MASMLPAVVGAFLQGREMRRQQRMEEDDRKRRQQIEDEERAYQRKQREIAEQARLKMEQPWEQSPIGPALFNSVNPMQTIPSVSPITPSGMVAPRPAAPMPSALLTAPMGESPAARDLSGGIEAMPRPMPSAPMMPFVPQAPSASSRFLTPEMEQIFAPNRPIGDVKSALDELGLVGGSPMQTVNYKGKAYRDTAENLARLLNALAATDRNGLVPMPVIRGYDEATGVVDWDFDDARMITRDAANAVIKNAFNTAGAKIDNLNANSEFRRTQAGDILAMQPYKQDNLAAKTDYTSAQADFLRGPKTANTEADTALDTARTNFITGPQTALTQERVLGERLLNTPFDLSQPLTEAPPRIAPMVANTQFTMGPKTDLTNAQTGLTNARTDLTGAQTDLTKQKTLTEKENTALKAWQKEWTRTRTKLYPLLERTKLNNANARLAIAQQRAQAAVAQAQNSTSLRAAQMMSLDVNRAVDNYQARLNQLQREAEGLQKALDGGNLDDATTAKYTKRVQQIDTRMNEIGNDIDGLISRTVMPITAPDVPPQPKPNGAPKQPPPAQKPAAAKLTPAGAWWRDKAKVAGLSYKEAAEGLAKSGYSAWDIQKAMIENGVSQGEAYKFATDAVRKAK